MWLNVGDVVPLGLFFVGHELACLFVDARSYEVCHKKVARFEVCWSYGWRWGDPYRFCFLDDVRKDGACLQVYHSCNIYHACLNQVLLCDVSRDYALDVCGYANYCLCMNCNIGAF